MGEWFLYAMHFIYLRLHGSTGDQFDQDVSANSKYFALS